MAKNRQWQLLDAVFSVDRGRVERVLAGGADPNGLVERMLPLVEACRAGTDDIAAVLLAAGADMERQDGQSSHNALTVSCEAGHPKVVDLLLRLGANPNVLRRGVRSPLADATNNKSKRRSGIVRVLLAAGADPRAVFHSEAGVAVSDVLMAACGSGSAECVGLLLDAGADVNSRHFFGTPLIAAVEGNRPDVVALLLGRGADPSPRLADDPKLGDLAGKDALGVAVAKRYKAITALLSEN